jgi:hypothetical protein
MYQLVTGQIRFVSDYCYRKTKKCEGCSEFLFNSLARSPIGKVTAEVGAVPRHVCHLISPSVNYKRSAEEICEPKRETVTED